jgi:hypothetical protein
MGAHDVALNTYINRIAEMRLVNEQRAVLISGTEGLDLIDIVDMDTGKVVDEIPVWSPTISPSGRVIAYEKGYMAHFNLYTQTEYMVYDTTLGKAENRAKARQKNDPYDAGFMIYPPPDKAAPPRTEDDWHMSRVPFQWLNNSDLLAFVDQDTQSGQLSLVVADLRGPQAKVTTELLTDYCKGKQITHLLPDFTHAGTDVVNFTILPCGKVDVHVPGLQ